MTSTTRQARTAGLAGRAGGVPSHSGPALAYVHGMTLGWHLEAVSPIGKSALPEISDWPRTTATKEMKDED